MAGGNRWIFSLKAMAALVLVTAWLAGCGYKTMPVPPEEIVPQPVTDLRYDLNEKGVNLYWTFPTRTVRGEPLGDISSFALYRAVVPADDYCETCPIPFGDPISLPGGAIAEGATKQKTYTSTLLRPGHLYFFKVRARSGWWAESADSNIVSFMWNIPPRAPARLSAEAGDGRIRLQWDPVGTYIDGTDIGEPVKYRLYRSLGTGPFEAVGELLRDVSYTDTRVVNGRKYVYKVQAVTMYEKGMVGGGNSPPVTAVPVDKTAPPVPGGVRAVQTATAVKVLWEGVAGEDLQGYRIYRRTGEGGEPVRIGEVEAAYTLFTDSNPPDADSWYYSVASFDDAVPANESERSAEARAGR
jgi:hypothetical protein